MDFGKCSLGDLSIYVSLLLCLSVGFQTLLRDWAHFKQVILLALKNKLINEIKQENYCFGTEGQFGTQLADQY